jgi:hypothetical protein
MARLPGHNKYDLAYSIGRLQPVYVWTSSWGRESYDAYVKAHYVEVLYRGVRLTLWARDPRVRWEQVTPVSASPGAGR